MQTENGYRVEIAQQLVREGGLLEIIATVEGDCAGPDGWDGLRFIRAVDMAGRGVVLTSAEMSDLVADRDGDVAAALSEESRKHEGY